MSARSGETVAEQAARLGIRLGEKVLEPRVTVKKPRKARAPRDPDAPPRVLGRPRLCEHTDRRPQTIIRGGKEYRITYCRTCSNERERNRKRAQAAELATLRALADTVSGT